MFTYYAIYKPYDMLSQFTQEGNHPTLKDIDFQFPKDVYPVGRLDADSEGLLLLTNDKRINSKLLDPENGHIRTYWVQVDGDITEEAIEELKRGMEINVNGKYYRTRPAQAKKMTDLPQIPERNPPVRFRKNIPTSWIELTLVEGKNRQVRKMTAKCGFPTLRLIRKSIVKLTLNELVPGSVRIIEKSEFYAKLGLQI